MIDLLVLDDGLKESSSSSAAAGHPLSPSRRLSTESKNSTEEEIVVDDDSNDSTAARLNIKLEENRNCVEIATPIAEISVEGKEKAPSVRSSRDLSAGTLQSVETTEVGVTTGSSPSASLSATTAAAMALSSSSSSSSSVSSGASSPSPVSSTSSSHHHKSHQEYLNAISTAINTLSKSSNGTSCSLRVTGEHSPLHHHLGSVLAGVRENGSNGADGAKVLLTTGSPLWDSYDKSCPILFHLLRKPLQTSLVAHISFLY